MLLRRVSDVSKCRCYVHGVRARKANRQTWNKKKGRAVVWGLSRAGGGGLQMLHRSSEADNVLPRLPQGPRLQWSVLIWVSSKLVLQGSAVLTVIPLASAVSHLLVTSCGNIDTLKNRSLNRLDILCSTCCTVPDAARWRRQRTPSHSTDKKDIHLVGKDVNNHKEL